jgi:hypothetical protein
MTPQYKKLGTWDSLVGIVTGWTALVRPAGARDIRLLHSVQTDSGAQPASYPMATRISFPGGKAAEAWSWPLTSILCRGQEWWNCTSNPHHVFMPWCLIKYEQGKLYPTFTLYGWFSTGVLLAFTKCAARLWRWEWLCKVIYPFA